MMRSWCLFVLVLLTFEPARAQVIPVPAEGGSSTPTQTFLWQAKEARAVLVMIPGGDGRIGLVASRTDLGGFYGKVLKPLSDPARTSGRTHVVVFDSPHPLPVGKLYPDERASGDHLRRIEKVVTFYRERLGRPVWLMGHSNGAISVAEFIRRTDGSVAGAIFSASRVGVKVSPKTLLPILFLHHHKDACPQADAGDDRTTYEALRAAGKNTAFTWVEGGSSEGSNVCGSGYHMYFGAEGEASRAIDAFMGATF
jgi:hypothetical protein